MWLKRIALFIGLCSFFNTFSPTQEIGLKIHKHVISISDSGKNVGPHPAPSSDEEEEMMAKF